MSLVVAVGHSTDPSLSHALDEIASSLEGQLAGTAPVAAVVFSCIDADHAEIVDAIATRWPGIVIVGCTSDGELSGTLAFQEDSLTVTLIGGEGIYASSGLGEGVSNDAAAAVDTAVHQVLAGAQPEWGEPCLAITLPEGLSACGADVLIGGLTAALPDGLPIVGGTSADQWDFERTVQFSETSVVSDGIPLLLLYGAMNVSVGVSSGWSPIGRRATVTESDGNVVHRIGDMTAMEFFRRYVGPHSEATPEYPIGVFPDGSETPYLRAPLSFEEESGTITFAGDVPQGTTIQITTAARDDMLDACRRSAQQAIDGLEGATPRAAFVFSCAARKQLLGTRTCEESRILAEMVPDIPTAGFYTFGEIAPYGGRVQADFHNETFVTVLLSEKAA